MTTNTNQNTTEPTIPALTELEAQVMLEITKDDFYEDGLDSSIWADCFLNTTSLSPKVVRGVLASLVKKELIYGIETGRDGVIAYTDLGKSYMKSKT